MRAVVPTDHGICHYNRFCQTAPLAELADRIDWTPFFQTWESTGRASPPFSTAEKSAKSRHRSMRRAQDAGPDRQGELVQGAGHNRAPKTNYEIRRLAKLWVTTIEGLGASRPLHAPRGTGTLKIVADIAALRQAEAKVEMLKSKG